MSSNINKMKREIKNCRKMTNTVVKYQYMQKKTLKNDVLKFLNNQVIVHVFFKYGWTLFCLVVLVTSELTQCQRVLASGRINGIVGTHQQLDR